MSNYELYLILNPILGNEGYIAESNKIQTFLQEKVGATDLKVTIEGNKKLAYPINKSWSGCYVSITFTLSPEAKTNIGIIEKFLNISTSVMRYMIDNLDEYITQADKQQLNETEIKTHRDLNKKNSGTKKCIVKHIGFRVIDYKNTEFLEQFMSPYAKIFGRERTGVSAKYQRKIGKAIKKARHMALLPFTAKHMD
jgi:small subunit ribosomal protein S18